MLNAKAVRERQAAALSVAGLRTAACAAGEVKGDWLAYKGRPRPASPAKAPAPEPKEKPASAPAAPKPAEPKPSAPPKQGH
jgi:hypothetical protein